MRADIKAKYAEFFGLDRPVTVRGCDHPACSEAGLHKAPKSRANLYDYYWFCLEHVREYNAAWDYHAGMSVAEIEEAIRFDTVWQRETWPVNADMRKHEADVRQKLRAEFFGDHMNAHTTPDETEKPKHGSSTMPSHVRNAMVTLGLTVDASFEEIRVQYKKLVKQYHPDANGGSREAEDKFKAINQAFTVLKAHYVAE